MKFEFHHDQGYSRIRKNGEAIIFWMASRYDSDKPKNWRSDLWFKGKELIVVGHFTSRLQAMEAAQVMAIGSLKEKDFEFFLWCEQNEL